MYLNQKNFIFNVKDLSVILVKDANERFSDNNQGSISVKNARKKINNIDLQQFFDKLTFTTINFVSIELESFTAFITIASLLMCVS